MATNNALNAKTVGIQSKTTAGVFNGRTLTGTANQIGMTNGDGTSGDPTIALTSTIRVSGISFDAGVNSLTIYTNGTFTPTFTNQTTPPTLTYTAQLGRYTRIGNKIMMNLYISLATYAAGSGALQIAGLPFNPNGSSGNSPEPLAMYNVTFTVGVVGWYLLTSASTTTATIRGNVTNTAVSGIVAGGAAANSVFISTLCYEI